MLNALLPILGIVLTAFAGVLTYTIQENRKRQTALAERRQALYEKLIRDLVDLLIAKTGAERSQLITEIEKGWLFASDKVLKACYEFLEIYDDLCCVADKDAAHANIVLSRVRADEETRRRIAQSLARIFLAMRLDVRSDTRIKAEWARAHFKIYDWGAIAQGGSLIEPDKGTK